MRVMRINERGVTTFIQAPDDPREQHQFFLREIGGKFEVVNVGGHLAMLFATNADGRRINSLASQIAAEPLSVCGVALISGIADDTLTDFPLHVEAAASL